MKQILIITCSLMLMFSLGSCKFDKLKFEDNPFDPALDYTILEVTNIELKAPANTHYWFHYTLNENMTVNMDSVRWLHLTRNGREPWIVPSWTGYWYDNKWLSGQTYTYEARFVSPTTGNLSKPTYYTWTAP